MKSWDTAGLKKLMEEKQLQEGASILSSVAWRSQRTQSKYLKFI